MVQLTVNVNPDPNDLIGNFNIIRQSPLGVAPMMVTLTPDIDSITGTSIATTPSGRAYQPRFSDLYFDWSITPLGYTFDKIDRPTAYRGTEDRYGPMAMYTMRNPGSYEVVCTMTDPTTGLQGVIRQTFIVADPSTVFTNANTWVVDINDVGSANYPGANVVTTLNDAMDGVRNNVDRTAPCKIVCLNGQTYSTSRSSFTPNTSTASPSVHVVADGAGAAPILNISSGITHDTSVAASSQIEHVWQGVVMQGTYDPEGTTVPANAGAVTIGYNIRRNHPEVTLFDDFEMTGFHQYFATLDIGSGDPITDAASVYMNDSSFTGYYYYATIANFNDFVTAGTFWGSDTNAWWGTGSLLKYGTRFSRLGNLCIHNSDVFCILAPSRTQGLFRTINEGIADDTKVQLTGSKLVGGSQSFLNSVVTGNQAPEADFLIDRCMVILSSEANKGVIASRGAFTMRSSYVIAPDLTYSGTGGLQSLIELTSPDVPSGELDAPVKVYNNTLISLRASAPTFINNSSGFTNAFVDNNLTLTAAQAASADYDLTELFGTPILIGLRSDSNPAAAKDAGTTPAVNSAALARPVSNTTVNNPTGSVSTGQVAYKTFDGSLNPGIIGALAA